MVQFFFSSHRHRELQFDEIVDKYILEAGDMNFWPFTFNCWFWQKIVKIEKEIKGDISLNIKFLSTLFI